jgi:hypothetical protein
LQRARRKVSEQELLIAVYKKNVEELEEAGEPDEFGIKMLELLQNSLADFRSDLAQLSN